MAERLHVLNSSHGPDAEASAASSIPGFGPEAPPREPIDLAAVRQRVEAEGAVLAGAQGTGLWRSLDELAGTNEFQDWLHREFPRQASEWVEAPNDGVSRRRFLQLSGASLALAGLAACTKQPEERVIPYVKMPEDLVPGRPMTYATTIAQGGYGIGVLAESHQGRPTKVEGNPEHPASLGSTDAKTQAAVLDLYDPARSQAVTHLGRLRSWSAFTNEVMPTLRALGGLSGEGLRFLSGSITSPTIAAQMESVLAFYPQAKWHRWEPAAPHNAHRAAQLAFGAPQATHYDLTKAKVVVSLGSDFLTQGPASVRYSRDFSTGRHPRHHSGQGAAHGAESAAMNRLYVVESMPTATATLADHRLALPPAEIEAFALALARALGAAPAGAEPTLSDKAKGWVGAVAEDLKAHAGASVVIADEYGSAEIQVLAHAMNAALGNFGATVVATAPIEAAPVDHVASITELASDLVAGKVELLVILGSNPVYDAPADLDFAAAIQKARLRVHLGLHDDETAELCQWHVPMLHAFEGWGDLRAYDGTASIVQPLIEPLYGKGSGSKTISELLAVFAEQPDATSYDLVRGTWQPRLVGDFEAEWKKALHGGVIPSTAEAVVTPVVDAAAVASAASAIAGRKAAGDDPGSLALLYRPDPTLYDGSLANNGWLQELPKPLTKLVWDNALIVSPKTAQKLGLTVENQAEISWKGRKLEVGIWVQPGHADGCATLHLGYGRRRIGTPGGPAATGFQGELCIGHGFNAYLLRTTDALWEASAVAFAKKPGRYIFASTQNHHLLESGASEFQVALEETEKRKPVKTGTWEQFQKNPEFLHAAAHHGEPVSLIPDVEYPYYAWGMSIDLSSCTGCNACVIACQAENNIPVVGKDQVLRGREMHWIRIDRYFEGSLDEPVVHNQPVPCMHCETAPCELVCPVAATAHSEDGLNDMAYNRCVGTRYCANNCPYKVRRFNFLRYANKDVPVLKLIHNPDVTVRMRGVMEKCTYCVQRINVAKIDAGVAGRKVGPGDIVTACQQACPTQAIAFGDNKNDAWESTRRKAEPLDYSLLEELNTRPRTTYMAKLNNPNPRLTASGASASERS